MDNIHTEVDISFRGVCLKDKIMIYGDLSRCYDGSLAIAYWVNKVIDPEINHNELVLEYSDIDPKTLGVGSVFVDRTGKRIYSGDTLKRYEVISSYYDIDGDYYEPKIVEANYGVYFKDGGLYLGRLYDDNNTYMGAIIEYDEFFLQKYEPKYEPNDLFFGIFSPGIAYCKESILDMLDDRTRTDFSNCNVDHDTQKEKEERLDGLLSDMGLTLNELIDGMYFIIDGNLYEEEDEE